MKLARPILGLFLIQADMATEPQFCSLKPETSMALMEIAPGISMPSMVVTRAFDGVKATICDTFEPMNDFKVSPTKLCFDGRSGEALDGVRQVYVWNEAMGLKSHQPVEPPAFVEQEYRSWVSRCGYVI